MDKFTVWVPKRLWLFTSSTLPSERAQLFHGSERKKNNNNGGEEISAEPVRNAERKFHGKAGKAFSQDKQDD